MKPVQNDQARLFLRELSALNEGFIIRPGTSDLLSHVLSVFISISKSDAAILWTKTEGGGYARGAAAGFG